MRSRQVLALVVALVVVGSVCACPPWLRRPAVEDGYSLSLQYGNQWQPQWQPPPWQGPQQWQAPPWQFQQWQPPPWQPPPWQTLPGQLQYGGAFPFPQQFAPPGPN